MSTTYSTGTPCPTSPPGCTATQSSVHDTWCSAVCARAQLSVRAYLDALLPWTIAGTQQHLTIPVLQTQRMRAPPARCSNMARSKTQHRSGLPMQSRHPSDGRSRGGTVQSQSCRCSPQLCRSRLSRATQPPDQGSPRGRGLCRVGVGQCRPA